MVGKEGENISSVKKITQSKNRSLCLLNRQPMIAKIVQTRQHEQVLAVFLQVSNMSNAL